MFSNEVTGLNLQNSKTACNAWDFQVGQSAEVLENFNEFSSIGARVVSKEPTDALRKGYFIESEGIEEQGQRDIEDWNRRRGFLSKFNLARQWERLFGGSLIFMGIDDSRDVSEPVDVNNIRAIGSLTVLSRWDVHVNSFVNDPITGELARPAAFFLNDTSIEIHPSRCIIFPGLPLTVRRTVANNGWGGSVINRAWKELENYTTTHAYLAEAITRITQGVFKTPSLTQAMSADCEQAKLTEQRLDAMGQWLGILGDIVVGEGEDYNVVNRGLQGFKEAAEVFADAVTAATDIPRSILFGLTPGGLNSGENAGDWQSWTSHLSGIQTELYDPKVSYYQGLVFRAGNSPLSFVPDRWTINWPSLFEDSALEKSQVLVNVANAATTLATGGIISDNEARMNSVIQEAFPEQKDTILEEDVPSLNEESEAIEEARAIEEAEREEDTEGLTVVGG